jgi:hypothetical protein
MRTDYERCRDAFRRVPSNCASEFAYAIALAAARAALDEYEDTLMQRSSGYVFRSGDLTARISYYARAAETMNLHLDALRLLQAIRERETDEPDTEGTSGPMAQRVPYNNTKE